MVDEGRAPEGSPGRIRESDIVRAEDFTAGFRVTSRSKCVQESHRYAPHDSSVRSSEASRLRASATTSDCSTTRCREITAHLIVEADDENALGRGMKAIGSRLARAVNRVFRRSGAVLVDRYHLRALRTPREVRNAL
jgi:hypothetical protein